MKLNKSVVIITLSLLVGILFFLLYQKYKELNNQAADAIQSIPINAALIIESENWNSTLKDLDNTILWKTISNSEDWIKIRKTIESISLKLQASDELKKFINNKKLYLSFHHSTNDFYTFLSTSCNTEELKLIYMNDTLIGSFKSREYDGVKVYELDNNWNLCHHKDI